MRPAPASSRTNLRFWYLVNAALLAALAAVLLFVPLFDLLGYEFCLVLAGGATLVGGQRGAARGNELRAAPCDALQSATREHHPLRFLLGRWALAAGETALLLLVPLALISLNALRVRNCNFAAGLTWFVVLPLASGTLAAAVGLAATLLTRRPFAVFAIIILFSISYSLYRFYHSPTISTYNVFLGYYPGSLYDEEVAIPAALWWARAQQLLSVGAGFSALALWRRRRLPRGALVGFVVCALPAALLFARRGTIGFARSARDVQAALGAVYTTPHFVLHYAPQGPFAHDIALYGEDHEFWWSQLEQRLGRAPTPPIHSYLFDSAAQKGALIGAASTSVAKPWRNEIYLQHEPWPHTVVAHELAHVFGAPSVTRFCTWPGAACTSTSRSSRARRWRWRGKIVPRT